MDLQIASKLVSLCVQDKTSEEMVRHAIIDTYDKLLNLGALVIELRALLAAQGISLQVRGAGKVDPESEPVQSAAAVAGSGTGSIEALSGCLAPTTAKDEIQETTLHNLFASPVLAGSAQERGCPQCRVG